MNRKLIFFDIDGTLLDDNKRLPDSTKQSIADLKREGHVVALATGRAPFTFKPVLEELMIDTYVSINGQYVVHHGDAIYKNPLSTPVIEELKDYAEARNHPLMYVSDDAWYVNTEDHPHVKTAIDSLKVGQDVTYQPAFYQTGDVYQSLLFCPSGSEADYQQAFGHLDFIRWHDYSVDVLPCDGSKAVGVERVIRQLGFAHEDVYAFGDGLNDVKMLQSVKNSIAMGNGFETVKDAARIVTRSVNDDGIWHGLRKVGLLK